MPGQGAPRKIWQCLGGVKVQATAAGAKNGPENAGEIPRVLVATLFS